MSASLEIAEKSVSAALSAIEIYNKPDFQYREESFSILLTNAWELLLKAKWVSDKNEDISRLYEFTGSPPAPKTNRSGNPITFGLTYLANCLVQDPNSGFTKPCHDNVLALIEVRNNAIHFVNKDLNFGRKIQELGTASLRNYLNLVTEWFQIDLSRYNFFLMPLSFYHGFETIHPASVTPYNEQMTRLLEYIDALEQENPVDENEPAEHSFTMTLETRLIRGRSDTAVEFRWTDDPDAPTLSLREEDVLKNFPLTYRELTDKLKRRYADFVENRDYHKHRKEIQKQSKYCLVRLLNPASPKSAKTRFYSPEIFKAFDKIYTKRK